MENVKNIAGVQYSKDYVVWFMTEIYPQLTLTQTADGHRFSGLTSDVSKIGPNTTFANQATAIAEVLDAYQPIWLKRQRAA